MKCSVCGSTKINVSPEGGQNVLVFHHELDLRHVPPELSEKELQDIHDESLDAFSGKLKQHLKLHERKK
jgi:hypothetical protein